MMIKNRLQWPLYLSLTVNLLLVGVLLGGHFRQYADNETGNRKASFEITRIVQSLPENRRKVFEVRLNSLMEKRKVERNKMRVLKRDIRQILLSDPFDQAGYEQKVDSLNTLRYEMIQERAKMVSDLAAYLPLKARRRLFERKAWVGKRAVDFHNQSASH